LPLSRIHALPRQPRVDPTGGNGQACAIDAADAAAREGEEMFPVDDFLQWDRFVTPSIIKPFYVLAVVVVVLFGLAGMISALGTMVINPITGLLMLIAGFAAMLAGIVFARIAAELVLIIFRINEHLGAIRNREGR
jgi:hypothetical protein